MPGQHPVQISEKQKTKFLELIRAGKTRQQAAQELGTTGSRFRALVRVDAPHYDETFAAEYAAALQVGRAALNEELDIEALSICFDRDNPSQARALHNERIYRNPDYRAAHTAKLALGARAASDGKVEILLAFSDPASDDGDG